MDTASATWCLKRACASATTSISTIRTGSLTSAACCRTSWSCARARQSASLVRRSKSVWLAEVLEAMGNVNSLPKEVPVLIVGAGPIGLALAAYLGKQGVETLLVERGEDRLGSPKMIVVSARTMEFCRHLGIAESARNWGFP